MSMFKTLDKSLRILFNKRMDGVLLKTGFLCATLPVQTTKLSRLKFINQNVGFRSIATSSNSWANVSFNLTDIGEGIREVVVKEWFVRVGDRVSQFDNICEVQSDKASVTITSRYDGTITKLHYAIDAVAHVGKPLVNIETESDEGDKDKPEEQLSDEDDVPKIEENNPKEYKKALCIPSVRRLAQENNVDLSNIEGTGKDGRVLKEDVLNYLQLSKGQTELRIQNKSEIQKSIIKGEQVEEISGFKKAMFKTMTNALSIPHFLYCDEIAVTKLNQIRNAIKQDAKNAGIKLTVLPFFIKAVSNALREYPILNSSLDPNYEHIIYHNIHNIGIAMDSPIGLAVPVIKNVNKSSILEIAKELNRLMQSGKQGSFHPNDLMGGTFTISNIGAIGGTYAAPIILSPQTSIIAIGATKVQPRFDSSHNIIAEEIINVSASADHRVIDGATMAHFVNFIKKQVENPYLLFLNA